MADLTWHEVMNAAGMTPWDLSGSMIHGAHQVWVWPSEVYTLEGQCGHLFHDGSDPYLCGSDLGHHAPMPSEAPRGPSVSNGHRPTAFWALRIATFSSVISGFPRLGSVLALMGFLRVGTMHSPATPLVDLGENEALAAYDNTQTCNVGWCHELACQTTHFAVSSSHLLGYFARHSPYNTIRVSLWTPFRGPVLFDIHRGSQLSEFDEFLLVSGHDPDRHVLYVAFDSQATSPDIISVPAGDTVWWIVRDGLSRELLRPVSPWYEPPDRLVATINSHGQASTITFSPEVATMRRLPQGARGNTAVAMSRVYGYLTAQGLLLVEVAIGSLTAARELMRSRAPAGAVIALAWLPLIAGMQHQQEMIVRSGQRLDPWNGAARTEPQVMRIWTHTLEAPLTLPYHETPDTNRLCHCVASTRRGVPPTGEFIWTQPRLVQGVAHILHIPRGAYPTLVFWLLHYRARAHVIAAPPGAIDWGSVGQQASEAFGENFFGRGAFSLQYHSGTIGYGTIVNPPHGAILHLIRTVAAPQTSANVWDTSPEPVFASHFDYDICMGPRGEVTLVEGDQREGQRVSDTRREVARSAELGLLRQVNEVCHQLETLTTRLESAGLLPTSTAEEVPVTEAESQAGTTARSAGLRPRFLWALTSLYFLWGPVAVGRDVIPFVAMSLLLQASGDEDSEGSASGPEPPSSPDLEDVHPPTPTASEPPTISAMPILRPSGSSLACTSAPTEGEIAPVQAAFPPELVRVTQRRVAAALQGVNIEAGPVPFLPVGCPVSIHNPFTGQTQCPALSSRVGTAHQLTEVLQDYAGRRGWQPIVCVQPQPDASSVHLIPTAADERYVSVLFRNGQVLQPRCIERDFRHGPYTEVPFQDRTGRLRIPQAIRRNSPRVIRLRDGDCLHVDTGPFGPPPPQPARSQAASRGTYLIALGTVAAPRLTLLMSLLLLVQSSPSDNSGQLGGRVPRPLPATGAYPWRSLGGQGRLSQVSGRFPCRCALVCPWTGRHGAFQLDPFETLERVQARFNPLLPPPRGLSPVWPSPRQDCLTCVPSLGCSSPLVCVFVIFEHLSKALIIPRRLTVADLRRVICYLTDWPVDAVRLPPALWARLGHNPQAMAHLRDGDVIDVSREGDPRGVILGDNALLKDHTLWTRAIQLRCPAAVRLWLPDVPNPVLTWLRSGDEWCPDRHTFPGRFAESYPGRWMILLMEFVASVLSGISRLVTSLTIFTLSQPISMCSELPTVRRMWCPCGTVWDSFMYPDDAVGPWASSVVLGDPALAGLASTLFGQRLWGLCIILQGLGAWGVGESSRSPTRSRSISRSRMRSSSPRFGLWRPDHPQPMQRVIHRYHCDYRVLCPFRGGRFQGYFLPDSGYESILSLVQQATGTWAQGFVLVAPACDDESCLLCPTGTDELVTVVLSAGGRKTAVLVPQRLSWNDLLAYSQRLTGMWGATLHAPPALLIWARWPANHLHLRHGDTFHLEYERDHPVAEGHAPGTFGPLMVLPHRSAWARDFNIGSSGWVYVWDNQGHPDTHQDRYWIHRGSRWIASRCQFVYQGRAVGRKPWIPVPSLGDDYCHFVVQSECFEARVIVQQAFYEPSLECRLLSYTSADVSLPGGLRYRADVEAAAAHGPPRDGDVLIPTSRGSHFSLSWLVPFILVSRHGGFRWVASVVLLSQLAPAMMRVPLEAQQVNPVRVGKYPWRIPLGERVLHESVSSGCTARLWSPFALDAELTDVSPDTNVEEIRLALAGREPAWSVDIVPVWPALWHQTLTFVPSTGEMPLVVIMVVSSEWQLTALIPCRTDLSWLLGHLRQLTPGPMCSVRAPPASCTLGCSVDDAIDWRTGDVVLAFDTHDVPAMFEPPEFTSGLQVRSAACWAHDFITNCELPLVLWAPEWGSVHTRMPPRGRWDAAAQSFIGRFGRRFPGRWVPVPWAYSDDVHLCRRADDPLHCNVILEVGTIEADGCHLNSVCRTLSSRSNRASLAHIMQTAPNRISVLGIAADVPWPLLRDGDIVHQQPAEFGSGTSQTDTSSAPSLTLSLGMGLLLLRLPSNDALLGTAFCVAIAALTLWEELGIAPSLPLLEWGDLQQRSEEGPPINPTLQQLSCYFAAWGAPSWTRLRSSSWFFDLSDACDLQARLHSLWCQYPLQGELPLTLHPTYRLAWASFPQWPGGVPAEILISTDGSSSHAGSCAFIVWCFHGGQWFRLGWFAAALHHLPWSGSPDECHPGPQRSYRSELAALQSAGLWALCALDMWSIQMGSTAHRVTIAVDNLSAMQVAAGWAEAKGPTARRCREIWQAVQPRCQLHYHHVPSHVGVLVNTLADALAEHAHTMASPLGNSTALQSEIDAAFLREGPWLWLIPKATLVGGAPGVIFTVPSSDVSRAAVSAHDSPASATSEAGSPPPPASISSISLKALTANVQSIKDTPPNPFNPSGHAANTFVSRCCSKGGTSFVYKRHVVAPADGPQRGFFPGDQGVLKVSTGVKCGSALKWLVRL